LLPCRPGWGNDFSATARQSTPGGDVASYPVNALAAPHEKAVHLPKSTVDPWMSNGGKRVVAGVCFDSSVSACSRFVH
jgi:hypothetical protein